MRTITRILLAGAVSAATLAVGVGAGAGVADAAPCALPQCVAPGTPDLSPDRFELEPIEPISPDLSGYFDDAPAADPAEGPDEVAAPDAPPEVGADDSAASVNDGPGTTGTDSGPAATDPTTVPVGATTSTAAASDDDSLLPLVGIGAAALVIGVAGTAVVTRRRRLASA